MPIIRINFVRKILILLIWKFLFISDVHHIFTVYNTILSVIFCKTKNFVSMKFSQITVTKHWATPNKIILHMHLRWDTLSSSQIINVVTMHERGEFKEIWQYPYLNGFWHNGLKIIVTFYFHILLKLTNSILQLFSPFPVSKLNLSQSPVCIASSAGPSKFVACNKQDSLGGKIM